MMTPEPDAWALSPNPLLKLKFVTTVTTAGSTLLTALIISLVELTVRFWTTGGWLDVTALISCGMGTVTGTVVVRAMYMPTTPPMMPPPTMPRMMPKSTMMRIQPVDERDIDSNLLY